MDELAAAFRVKQPLHVRALNALMANRVELGILTLVAYIGLGVLIYANNSVYCNAEFFACARGGLYGYIQ